MRRVAPVARARRDRRVRARRARRSFAAVALAAARGRAGSARDRVSGLHGRVGCREQRAGGARDPRTTSTTASPPASPTCEIRAAYVARLRRAHPAEPGRAAASRSLRGACRSSCSCSPRRGHRRRAAPWSREPRLTATADDEVLVARHREHELRRATDERLDSSWKPSASSCCGRSTISSPSAMPATSTTRRTETLHDDYTAARGGGDPVARATASRRCRPRRPGASRRMKVITVVVHRRVRRLSPRSGSRARSARGSRARRSPGNARRQPATDASTALAEAAARPRPSPTSYDAAHRVRAAAARHATSPARSRSTTRRRSSIPASPSRSTYVGWINALAASSSPAGAQRDAVAQRALASLTRRSPSIRATSTPTCSAALTHMNVLNDPAAAIPDFQQFLVLAPQDHPQRELGQRCARARRSPRRRPLLWRAPDRRTARGQATRPPDRRVEDLPHDDHDQPRHDRDGPRPAARAEHRQQLRRPRARRLLRRAHVPPRRARSSSSRVAAPRAAAAAVPATSSPTSR